MLGDFAMAPGALNWLIASPSQFEPEPFQPIENCVDRRWRRALAIGVLDAQQELAAECLA